MKMDLEDLRAEFERYRGRHQALTGGPPFRDLQVEPIEVAAIDGDDIAGQESDDSVPAIRLTSDMTMDDVEREAIRFALEEVRGNRRKAAERLGVVPERAVVVEDAISGVQAGRTGGFGLVIGVDRKGDPESLRQGGADIVVRDLSELL